MSSIVETCVALIDWSGVRPGRRMGRARERLPEVQPELPREQPKLLRCTFALVCGPVDCSV
eukprot:11183479-Lingulodinium_polyedra.AAC.1